MGGFKWEELPNSIEKDGFKKILRGTRTIRTPMQWSVMNMVDFQVMSLGFQWMRTTKM